MATEFKRFSRLLAVFLPLSVILVPTMGAAEEAVARVVTRMAEQLPDNAVIWAQPGEKSDLNDRLAEEFRIAIRQIGRAPAGNGEAPVYSLVFDGGVMGSVDQRDTSIGRLEGDAEGNLDFQLKLWSSGGGSSLFQGQGQSGSVNMRGFRMNATLHLQDKVVWQGYVATNTGSGDPFDVLAPLVQVLIDRLDISSDEIVPLR